MILTLINFGVVKNDSFKHVILPLLLAFFSKKEPFFSHLSLLVVVKIHEFYLFSILKSILVIIFYAPKLMQVLSPSDLSSLCLWGDLICHSSTFLFSQPTTCPRLAFNFSRPNHSTSHFSKCPRTFLMGVVFRTKIWEWGLLLLLFLSRFSQQSYKALFKLWVYIDMYNSKLA